MSRESSLKEIAELLSKRTTLNEPGVPMPLAFEALAREVYSIAHRNGGGKAPAGEPAAEKPAAPATPAAPEQAAVKAPARKRTARKS